MECCLLGACYSLENIGYFLLELDSYLRHDYKYVFSRERLVMFWRSYFSQRLAGLCVRIYVNKIRNKN